MINERACQRVLLAPPATGKRVYDLLERGDFRLLHGSCSLSLLSWGVSFLDRRPARLNQNCSEMISYGGAHSFAQSAACVLCQCQAGAAIDPLLALLLFDLRPFRLQLWRAPTDARTYSLAQRSLVGFPSLRSRIVVEKKKKSINVRCSRAVSVTLADGSGQADAIATQEGCHFVGPFDWRNANASKSQLTSRLLDGLGRGPLNLDLIPFSLVQL